MSKSYQSESFREQKLSDLSFIEFNPLLDDYRTIPNSSGVYILCARDINQLPEQMRGLNYSYLKNYLVLYAGISSGAQGLKNRDYRNHFHGCARNSTVRKSLGVLFGYDKYFYTNGKYKFIPEHEKLLTQWMKSNILLFYYSTNYRISDIESDLIHKFNPPLNIQKNFNIANYQFKEYLLQLRNTCKR